MMQGILTIVTKGILRKVLVLAQISPFKRARCKDHLVNDERYMSDSGGDEGLK